MSRGNTDTCIYVYIIFLFFPTTDFECIYKSIAVSIMSFIKINCNFESHDTYFDIFVDTVWFPMIRLKTSGDWISVVYTCTW